MGISYDGGMVVGCVAKEIDTVKLPAKYKEDEDWEYDWPYSAGMTTMSPWYDAEWEYVVIGFSLDDDTPPEKFDEFLEDVKKKSKQFEEITGIPGRLIAGLIFVKGKLLWVIGTIIKMYHLKHL